MSSLSLPLLPRAGSRVFPSVASCLPQSSPHVLGPPLASRPPHGATEPHATSHITERHNRTRQGRNRITRGDGVSALTARAQTVSIVCAALKRCRVCVVVCSVRVLAISLCTPPTLSSRALSLSSSPLLSSPIPSVPSAMGLCLTTCCLPSAYKGNWTEAELRAGMEPNLAALPLAEMQPGNVIKVNGNGGCFNPAPLLNPGWLQQRMTQDESGAHRRHTAHTRPTVCRVCAEPLSPVAVCSVCACVAVCVCRYVSLLRSINDVVLSSYIGKPKVTVRVNGQLQGEDPNQRAFAAVRAWMAQAAPWWLQQRGVNIAFQSDPEQVQRTSQYSTTRTNPCHLYLAIQDLPPNALEGAAEQAPPAYRLAVASAPPAETMGGATVVRVQPQTQ